MRKYLKSSSSILRDNKKVIKVFFSDLSKARFYFSALVVIVLFTSTIAFQNCAVQRFKGFTKTDVAQKTSLDQSSSTPEQLVSQNSEPYPASIKESITLDPNCLNNTDFDACIFWKNPVATKGSIYTASEFANIGQYQTVGVKLTGANAPTDYLETNTFRVKLKWDPNQSSTDKTIRLGQNSNASKWRINLNSDLQNQTYYLPQFTAYFYLNFQKEFMKNYAGGFYVETDAINSTSAQNNLFNNTTRKIIVNAYTTEDDSLINNAYYSSSSDSIREGSSPNAQFKIMGNDAEIIMHEMGHANLHHATHIEETWLNYTQQNSKFLVCEQSTITQGCKTNTANKIDLYLLNRNQINEIDYPASQWLIYSTDLSDGQYGNYSAINEGQADFHANIFFRERPGVAETVLNSVDENNWIMRSPLNPSQKNWQALDFYQNQTFNGLKSAIDDLVAASGSVAYNYTDRRNDTTNAGKGECHNMGALYSTILWEIYTNPLVVKTDFLNIFSEHLKLLSLSDDFKSALRLLLSIDSIHYEEKYREIITTAFSNKGIALDP